jgi:RNA polymerase sigma-70 factor (ECF subfamily)
MSYFGEVDLGPSFQPFHALQELFGFVPNLFRAQTLLPRLIEAEAGLAAAVLWNERVLSRSRKEFMALLVSAAYGNTSCFTQHHQTLRSLGVPDHQLDQIVTDHHQADLSSRDTVLLDFALKLAISAPWLSREDITVLQDQGFTDESILEAILVTGLTGFFCTLSTGLGVLPDFEPRAIPGSHKVPPPDKRLYVGGTAGPYLPALELSPESFPPFAFFVERFGLVPRIFRAQTLRTDLIEAEVDVVRTVLVPEDILSHVQKECIFLVGSAANLNTYCVAAHCEMLRRMEVSTEESDQIAVDHHQAELSEADKRLLDFALKLTARSSEFECEDVELLRRHGFSEEHILEAVAATALNNFFNTLQMGLGTTPDFEARHVFGPKDAHLSSTVDRPTEGTQVDPDAELVARVQGGDLDAFEELVSRHSRRVYRTLMGILGSIEEAQDAMQDTFLKAFQHIGEFQGRSKFSTWLVTIANNTGVQRLRERRHVESLDDIPSEADAEFRPRQVRAWAEDPEQLCSQAERRELVESAMMQLPPKYRVVLVLRDIEQLSGAEVAAALGLGIPAMKARLLRARLMLREALAPHFVSSAKRMSL